MILVFDLDDTLYEEITFVHSGFRAVSSFLSEGDKSKSESIFQQLVTIEREQGRGKIFDEALQAENKWSKANVKKCISIYRLHFPNIQLPVATVDCLNRFVLYSKYIVTDGNKVVQANKVKALGIDTYFKKVFITHRYGVHHAKPSPYCFNKIASLEATKPSNIIYIGDNVSKDFVGIKPLGFKTIQVLTGNYKHYQKPEAYQADIKINDLSQLTQSLIDSLKYC